MTLERAKQWVLCGVAGALLVACGTPRESAYPDDAAPQAAAYRLTLLSDGTGWSVVARFPARFSGQRMCAPAIGTRHGEALEWQRVETEAGAEAVTWDREGCFDAPHFEHELEVEYRARTTLAMAPAWRASSLSPRVWARPGAQAVFFPGEALFIEPLGPVARAVETHVSLSLPDGWHAASTLDGGSSRWRAESARSLVSSALWAGEAGRERVVSADTRIWIDDAVPTLDAEAILVDTRCISGQLEGWRGTDVAALQEVPSSALLVLDAAWDAEARAGFARAGGAVLQLGSRTALDPDAIRSLIAHELFHRINGDEIRYEASDYAATTWFREGATSYVALVSLARAGLLDEAGFREHLANHASAYLASPVLLNPGLQGDARRRFEYDRGVLLAMALDATLRELSGGTRSLSGLFLHLVRAQGSGPLSGRDLEDALDRYAVADVSAFFTHYVDGVTELPVHALLRNVGFEVVPSSRDLADLGMWVRYDAESARMRVVDLTDEGPASSAGIAVGDEVLPVSETSWRSTAKQVWKVRRVRDGVERQVELVPTVRVLPAVELRPLDEDPGALWRRLLDGDRASTCSVARD